MANIRKTWYLWSNEIYDSTWQMGISVTQNGNITTNSSNISVYPILKNITQEPQELSPTADMLTNIDGQTVENSDNNNITTVQPNATYSFSMTPMNFYNVKHDIYGTKTISIHSEMTLVSPNITLSLDSLLTLLNIDTSNIVFTELNDTDKEAFYTGYVTIRTKVIVLPDPNHADEIVLTERDAVKTWSISEERYVPDNGFIGQFVARTLDGELQNITDDFNIENREVEVRIGIIQMGSDEENLTAEDGLILTTEDNEKVVNRTFNEDVITWYSLGNFLITKPEDDDVADNTRYEAFDYTVKFNTDFNADWKQFNSEPSFNETLASGGSYTALQLAKYVCGQVGVELATTAFSNANFVIKSNQFTEGNSCRDVMKAIAQLAYGWCRIGWDNKLYIDEPILDTTPISKYETLTNDNYYSLTIQRETYGPINRVVVGMEGIDGESFYAQDAESIEANGLHELYVYDNPITYTEELRNLSLNYASNLFGFTYVPFETETPGHLWLNANQPIALLDMQGNLKYTYPFNKTINYDGHIKTPLSGPAITEQEKTTAYNTSTYKTLRNVKIQVDKQEGVINIINSKVQASEDGLSSLETKFEQEITDTYSKQQIHEIINGTAEDGTVVSSVTTTAGTFDKNGLTIEQSTASTKTNVNADGMVIYNKTSSVTDPLLIVNSNGVVAKNVKVSTYLNIGSHSRIEDYTHTDYSQGTGVFWIGD